MSDLTKEQLEEGKKVLQGPTIYFWVLAIITGMGFLFQSTNDWWSKGLNIGPISIGLPGPGGTWIFVALYVAALVGLHMRKSWAVPVGRAGLVVSMVIFFPVGTIFGAILWKRFNDPIAKNYLEYKTVESNGAAANKTEPQATPSTTAVESTVITAEKPQENQVEKEEPKS